MEPSTDGVFEHLVANQRFLRHVWLARFRSWGAFREEASAHVSLFRLLCRSFHGARFTAIETAAFNFLRSRIVCVPAAIWLIDEVRRPRTQRLVGLAGMAESQPRRTERVV